MIWRRLSPSRNSVKVPTVALAVNGPRCVQVSTPGLAGYGAASTRANPAAAGEAVGPTNPGAIWESAPYVRMVPKLFEYLRVKLGDEVELLHDVHERVALSQAINLCKALEPYRLFFL